MAFPGGVMERSLSISILAIKVSSVVDQKAYSFQIAFLAASMERFHSKTIRDKINICTCLDKSYYFVVFPVSCFPRYSY
jgi:hypothetical protein